MKKKFTLLIALMTLAATAHADVGDVFTSGSFRYKVIAEGDVNEVEFTTPESGKYNVTANITTTQVTNNGITYTIVGIGEYAFQNASFPASSGNCNMPSTIRYVSDYAFKGVTSGSSTTRASVRFYGDALRYLSSKAFLDNELQGSVLVTNGDAENGFSQVNSNCSNADDNTGQMYLIAERGTKYILFPKHYPIGTVNGWKNANNVTINSAIKTIGAYAMMGCGDYETVNLGSVEVIDTAAFKNTKIKTLTIPATMKSIAPDAFEGTTTIESLTINCDLTDGMKDVVFDDAVYTRLKGKVNFGSNVDVTAYKENENWSKFLADRIFILGEVNGNSWAPNVGVEMTTTDLVTYTATVTTAGENSGYSYFSFSKALSENDGSNGGWDEIAGKRFGAVSDGDFLVDKSQLEKDLSLTYDGYQAFQIPAGTYILKLNTLSMTLNIEKVMPDVYVMGNVNGNDWAANVGDKMTWDKTAMTYSLRVKVTDEYGYFSFTTSLAATADDYNSIAGSRFGAVSNGDFEVTKDMVKNSQALSLSGFGTANAFKIPTGSFVLTISDLDEDTRNLVITGSFADELDTTPFDVGMFSYRRLSDSEVEMLGFNDQYPNEGLINTNFGTIKTITDENGDEYSVVAIGEEAFAGRSLAGQFTIAGLSNVREIKKGAFRGVGVPNTSNLARPLTLPTSLETIGDEAFAGSILSTLTIPANVTSIGNGIVAGVLRLQSISVASGNKAYKAVNGNLYTIDGTTLVAAAPQQTTLTVADGCTTIAPKAVMYDRSGNKHSQDGRTMTKVVLPASLTTIGEDAFKDRTTFTSIEVKATTPPTGGVFEQEVYDACKGNLTVPAGSEALYKADPNWGKFYEEESTALEGVEFTEGHNYATWYGDADLALPEGIVAYVVTGIEGDEATVESVSYLPANTGVLLYSEAEASNLSADAYTGTTGTVTSLLVGSNEPLEVTDGYLLYANAFYRAEAGTLAAHRCYLPRPAEAGDAPMRLRIVVKGDDTVTAVSDVNAAAVSVTYVSVTGQVSDRPFDGVNICLTRHADGTVTTRKIVK